MPDEAMTGTVKWFDNAKGFGFIAPDGSENDIFVHYSDILQEGFKTLHEGERVSFTPYSTPKGLQAGQVRKTEVQTESLNPDGSPGELEASPPPTSEPYPEMSAGEMEGASLTASAANPNEMEEPPASAAPYTDPDQEESDRPSLQGF
jgi:CspA family cold shock protein